jgi:hypothetical protein
VPDTDFLRPQPDQLRWWVAARVDLGTGQFSDPVRVAREQADAIVQLATFNRGRSTWEALEGYIHVLDGVLRRSLGPFHDERSEEQFLAEHDRTANEFGGIESTIGPHLPVVSPVLRRLLRA